MEEIVISKKKLMERLKFYNVGTKTRAIIERELAEFGISITDLQRQAFEAGREEVKVLAQYPNETSYFINKYDTFDDYQNMEK